MNARLYFILPIAFIAVFSKFYKFFKACFIKFSTEAFGVSLIILSIAFSAAFLAKPKTSKADNASSLFVLL